MIHQLFTMFNWLGSEWVLAILFALSIISGAVVLARWFELRKLQGASQRFWDEHGEAWFRSDDLQNWKSQITQLKASYHCLETDTLEIIERNHKGTDEEIERAVSAYLDHRKMKLEKFVGILGTIGANAPFIGLLGTVLGIIRAFHDMATQGLSQGMENISGGIAEALVATAVGLMVAIPAVIFFNILNKRISTLVRRAQSVSALALSQPDKKK